MRSAPRHQWLEQCGVGELVDPLQVIARDRLIENDWTCCEGWDIRLPQQVQGRGADTPHKCAVLLPGIF